MRGKLVEQNQVMNDFTAGMPKPSSRFHGEVTFIQGQNTFSSANYLLTLIKDNALFPIIGTPTSQKPTCFGDVLFLIPKPKVISAIRISCARMSGIKKRVCCPIHLCELH